MSNPVYSATLDASGEALFDICIVNFNTKNLTNACLRYVLGAIQGHGCTVWVVDNGSSDGSVEMLKNIPEIRLIERNPEQPEEGHTAHAIAIDLVFARTDKPYLILMHTDTIIYGPQAISMLLAGMELQERVGAVGCLEQVYEGRVTALLKKMKKGLSRKKKQLSFVLGLRKSPPRKSETSIHIRSFFSMWNVKAMKYEGLCFNMGGMNPGYMAQNEMMNRGYSFVTLSPVLFFRHLDHLEAATIAQKNPYHFKHRKTKRFQKKLNEILRKES